MIAFEIISHYISRDGSHHCVCGVARYWHCADRRWSYGLTDRNNRSAGSHGGLSHPMSLGNSLRCAASSRSRCNADSSSGSLRRGLALMAWPAKRFEIAVFVCTAVGFRNNVVDRFSRARSAVAQALLADVSITLEDADADNVPLTAIASLVAAQASLVLLPAFVAVSLAVARAVHGCT